MSTLKVNALRHNSASSDGVTLNSDGTAVMQVDGGMNFRNRIINGDMRIDQRNAGASVTNSSSTLVFPVDRNFIYGTISSKFTGQQNAGSVTPPTGFINYLGATSSSAYTVGAGEFFVISQYIEGTNIADLMWGTANAKTVTLSFWVRSSLTGTFGGALQNDGLNRSYAFTYTISAANTWEYKTVTIAGDTSGTWLTTNGVGIRIWIGLGVGSTLSTTAGSWAGADYRGATGATSVVGTNGATFYITGVQLEVGSVATPFERRPYGYELLLCQRYYYQYQGGTFADSSGAFEWMYPLITSGANYRRATIRHPVTMRATPTVGSITFRVNDASSPSGTAQYIGTASWSASASASNSSDYYAINGYTVSAEL